MTKRELEVEVDRVCAEMNEVIEHCERLVDENRALRAELAAITREHARLQARLLALTTK